MSATKKPSPDEIVALYNKHIVGVEEKKEDTAPAKENIKELYDKHIVGGESVDNMEPPESVSDSSQAEAALQGVGQGLTLQHLPQAQAKTELLLNKIVKEYGLKPFIPGGLDELYAKSKLKEQGIKYEEPEEDYVTTRDKYIARQEQLKKAHPGTFMASEIAGSIPAMALMPGGAAAKGASYAGKMLRAGAAGAALSAAQNPGDIPGEESPLQPEQRVKNAATGGAISSAAIPASSLIKGGLNIAATAGTKLKKAAETMAVRATGAMTKELRKEAGGNLGREIIDRGLIKAGDTLDDIAVRADKLRQETGKKIGELYEKVQARISDPKAIEALSDKQKKILLRTDLNTADIVREIEEKLVPKYQSMAGGTEAVNQIKARSLELLAKGQNPNIKDLNTFKSQLDDIIKYNTPIRDFPAAKLALKEFRDVVAKKVENRIRALGTIGGEGLKDAKALKELNKSYGVYAPVTSYAKNRIGAVSAKIPFGLLEVVGGGAVAGSSMRDGGASPEAFLRGLGAAAALKAGRTYGMPIAALGTNLLSKPASLGRVASPAASAISSAISNNPQAIGATAAQIDNVLRRKAMKEK